ncbi:MAG: DUF2723 domain-containing protein [Anaerolineae bacterium]|nr:DUF2723 domain-containing protein [Anaerolineae bacterium]
MPAASPSPGKLASLGRDAWWVAGLAVAALALYVYTLAPTVATVFDDSLEFQVVLPTLGIAHPTGYPLYTLVGWLFSRFVPLGDPAYRVNLLSAVAAAAAVGVLYLAARRVGSSRLAAAACCSLFAAGSVWWSQATIAEVYALHGLLVAVLLWLALGQGPRRWTPIAFVFGLGLAHHRTTLLLAPALAVLYVWEATREPALRRPRQWLALAAAAALPLALYLYLPLRGRAVTSLDGSYVNTWEGFWRHVLARDYGAFLAGNPLGVERTRGYGLSLLAEQVSLLGLLLGLWGWTRWRDQPPGWTFLALVYAANMLFAAFYRTADVDVFYLPAIMVWLAATAVGLTMALDQATALAAGLGRRLQLTGPPQAWLTAVQVALLALVLAVPLQRSARYLAAQPRPRTCAETLAVGEPPAFTPNRRREWSAINCGRAILSLPLPQGAHIVGLLGETTLLRYVQVADGARPDVVLIAADREAERLTAVEQALAAGRAVYLTRELPGAGQRYSLTAEGPLVRVWPAGQARPDPLPQAVDVAFGDAVRLVGFDLALVPARGAVWLRMRLAWQALAPVGEELKVSARLLRPDGSAAAAQDAVPVHWSYPTTAWRPGETVVDAYDFALPADTAGSLTPLVILYRAADGSEVGRFQP